MRNNVTALHCDRRRRRRRRVVSITVLAMHSIRSLTHSHTLARSLARSLAHTSSLFLTLAHYRSRDLGAVQKQTENAIERIS